MSHLNESQSTNPDNRNLGNEWENWNGDNDDNIKYSKWLFLSFGGAVLIGINTLLAFIIYMISPRIANWGHALPSIAWIVWALLLALSVIWLVQLLLTITTLTNFFFPFRHVGPFFNIIFSGVFKLATICNVSRDNMGHSFVCAYNAISRALKPVGKKEKLLILLPRCLTKDLIKEINGLKDIYPVDIHIVSGGELARKRIKELKPTAVIGIACERDLVSGIRDVGNKLSLIGIPNQRPEGPCKNTIIDMPTLIEAIEFYVGKPQSTE